MQYYAKAPKDGFTVEVVSYNGKMLTYKAPNGTKVSVDLTRFNRLQDWIFYKAVTPEELEKAFTAPAEVVEVKKKTGEKLTWKEVQAEAKRLGINSFGKTREEIEKLIDELQTS